MATIQPLYIFIGAFFIGVISYTLYFENAWLLLLCVTPLALRREWLLILGIVVLGYSLGAFRVTVDVSFESSSSLNPYIEQEVTLTGVVVSEPDVRANSVRLVLLTERVFDVEVETKVIFRVDRYPKFEYGDRVEVRGVLHHPESFTTETGRTFNYAAYLAKDKIYYTISFPEVTYLSSGHGHPIKHILFDVKHNWLANIQEHIPDPHASLAGGLVVGAKNSLGEELEEQFRKTGIIHIVVLSGYNVTIVAESLMRFFSFLPRMASFSLGGVSILLFAILTGASATIVRASIMAGLVLVARATHRKSDITHALILAAFFMVLHNPLIVLYDPSFQLSFLATVGLIYLSPLLSGFMTFIPDTFQLRDFATATISTQLFVMPLLLYMVGELSLVAVPVNMLVLSFIPITMLFSFLTGTLAFIHHAFSFPFGLISYILLSYELKVVHIFSEVSFASIRTPHIPLIGLILLYACIFMFLYVAIKKRTDS